jgi:hypothetical protein
MKCNGIVPACRLIFFRVDSAVTTVREWLIFDTFKSAFRTRSVTIGGYFVQKFRPQAATEKTCKLPFKIKRTAIPNVNFEVANFFALIKFQGELPTVFRQQS